MTVLTDVVLAPPERDLAPEQLIARAAAMRAATVAWPDVNDRDE